MKIISADIDIDFADIEKKHLAAWKQHVVDGLISAINGSSGNVKKFYEEVQKHQIALLTGKPAQLRAARTAIEVARSRISIKMYDDEKVNDKLGVIFNYDKFVDTYLPSWGAYKFCQSLNVQACLYCNRVFSHTLDKVDLARTFNSTKDKKTKRKILKYITSSKTRPELDHFYPKAKFRYLALAMYNLVPSCHICNSNLKGSRDIDFDNLINPYEHDFDEIVKIKPRLRNEAEIQREIDEGKLSGQVKDHFGYQLFLGKLSSFDLRFEKVDSTHFVNNTKADKHIDLYALEELYEMHKDHASRILKNSIIHGSGSVKDIFARHRNLFHSEDEVKCAILGTESIPDRINKFPLSKLAIDISRDFGI